MTASGLRNLAYVALLIVLLGVSTGWMGGP